MNKENKCALCSHRSVHNGICLIDNQDCKFKPNIYSKIFIEELEKLKEEVKNLCFVTYSMDGNTMFDITKGEIIYRINKHIEELKGENK